MMTQHRIRVRRLWREHNVGLRGWIGAELWDGTLVALCSIEKWELGAFDSLRLDWTGDERSWPKGKYIWTDISEAELRRDGLGSGRLRMRGRP